MIFPNKIEGFLTDFKKEDNNFNKQNNESMEPIEILERENEAIVFERNAISKNRELSKEYLKSVDPNFEFIPEPNLRIPAVRMMITDQCPYSCKWCGVYRTKLLEKGKISQEDFENHRVGSNEGDFVRQYNKFKDTYLSPEDYKYLVAVLKYYFNTDDATITGGDPFIRKEVREIIDNITDVGVDVTALTKGAPLFSKKNKDVFSEKTGKLSRLIFSIDTLDKEEYANLNLPLASKQQALGCLAKTIEALETAIKKGYKVEVNSVVPSIDFQNEKEFTDSFQKTKKLIDFALAKGVVKMKFIELDDTEIYGNPYIEKYFDLMHETGYFDSYNIIEFHSPELKNRRKDVFLILADEDKKINISACRCSCSSTVLHTKSKKLCRFKEDGDLYMNSSGEVVTCYKNHSDATNNISLRELIIERNTEELVKAFLAIDEKMKKIKCPIISR